MIPTRYSGSGSNLSPPLQWSGEPLGCKEFALICIDPDAPRSTPDHPFVHWLIYNISPAISFLPEGINLNEKRLLLPIAADQGINSFGRIGYAGPLPPIGHGLHHYHFKLFALNGELGIPPGIGYEMFIKLIEGHVIKTAEIVGVYERGINQAVMT